MKYYKTHFLSSFPRRRRTRYVLFPLVGISLSSESAMFCIQHAGITIGSSAKVKIVYIFTTSYRINTYFITARVNIWPSSLQTVNYLPVKLITYCHYKLVTKCHWKDNQLSLESGNWLPLKLGTECRYKMIIQ